MYPKLITAAVMLLAMIGLAACQPVGGAVPQTEEVTLYVGPEQVDCVGVGPQKCLLVKEDPNADYTYFYDSIEGFEYEPGYEYELRVLKTTVPNPPADASAYRWTLIEVVSKTPVETAAAPATTGPTLEGTQWVLTSYLNSAGEMVDAAPGRQAIVTFENGRLSGSTGCNNFSAAYTGSGDQLTIQPGPMTMMACEEPLMSQEQAVIANLASAASYQIADNQLQIANGDGQTVLVYDVLEATPLTGVTWVMTMYNNGQGGFASALADVEVTAVFGDDGKLSGMAGCNNYMTSYTTEGSSIQIAPAATTRKMCPDPAVMEQEAAYVTALSTAATYKITGDKLEMRDADGSAVASYVAKATAVAAPAEAAPADLNTTLANLTYQSEFTASGAAPLTDGVYQEEAAPGSATKTTVMLLPDFTATGELNGQPAAAVVLATDPGGSGTFYDLAVVIEQDGEWTNVATTSLGDRIRIGSVTIANNQITLEMMTQGPTDPMCCPTQQVTRVYELQGDALVLVEEKTASAPADDIVGVTWQWERFDDPAGNVIVVDDPARYTLLLQPDGTAVVQADCNRAGGTYTLEGSSLKLEVAAMTRMMCPPESLSNRYIEYLNNVATYVVQDGALYLNLWADSGDLKHVPAAEQ